MSHGTHVKALGVGERTILQDKKRIEHMLVTLVERLGMCVMSGPHMVEVEMHVRKLGREPFEDEGGVTGVVVLSTSHVAIHTWPLRPFFILDAFSCRKFDPTLLMDHIATHLGSTDVFVRNLSYALEWPPRT